MAGNTRGKIKEHFEGIHRNFDWIIYHCQEVIKLVAGKHPGLKKSAESLAKAVSALDKMIMDVYSKI